MKILIVNKFLHPNGGSETYIFEIGARLQTMGHEVQYFGMEHEGRIVGNNAGIYTSDMDFHGGGVRQKISKITYLFKIIHSRDAARKMTAVLEDFKPDVVHFNNINFQLTPAVIEAVADYDIKHKTDIKMIYTAHDSQWVCPNHLLMKADGSRCFECRGCKYAGCIKNRCIHGSRLRSTLGAFEGWYYHRKKTYGLVDTIITPSSFMKEILESDPVLRGKCRVLCNFIPSKSAGKNMPPDRDVSIHDTGDRPDEQTDAAAGGGRYALYFGRFSEEKGIDTLIDCVKELPDIDFVFAGTGPLENEINDLANVKNVGFTTGNALKDLVSGAEFAVFPSKCHENCSFTVMESISYGTPIIASNTGGTPELVNDGYNGVLFSPEDSAGLTALIRRLWDDPDYLEMLRNGCRKSSFMTVEEYCDELMNIYKER